MIFEALVRIFDGNKEKAQEAFSFLVAAVEDVEGREKYWEGTWLETYLTLRNALREEGEMREGKGKSCSKL